MENRDYASMSDEELRQEYSQIRALINRVEKRIDAICDNQDVSRIYHYNDSGEVVLINSDDFLKQRALYEMQEIVTDLGDRLEEIEENYKGTDLKDTPILEPGIGDDDNDYDDLSVDNPVHGRKL